MDSRIREIFLEAAAAGLSVLSFWNATGLEPQAWVLWVAAVPLLLAIQRMGTGRAFLVGFAVYALAEFSLWGYLGILPLGVRLAAMLVPALAFGGAVAAFRACLKRDWGGVAIFAFPCFLGAYEYVGSVVSPHGTFGHLAYTQMDFPAVIQLASLGGVWAVDFLPVLVSAAVAVAIGHCLGVSGTSAKFPRWGIVLAGCLVVCCLGWGLSRLASDEDATVVRVALLASDLPENDGLQRPELSGDILRRYLAVVPEAKRRGAEILVMPEHLLAVLASGGTGGVKEAEFESLLTEAARANQIGIVLGIDLFEESAASNQARFFLPDGTWEEYDKRHLLPGLEARFSPGDSEVVVGVESEIVGLAICKDLDFSAVARSYSQRGVGALLVPAYDFVDDGWLHSRMAVMRGVEGGFGIARAARSGRLTVSDFRGRMVGESNSGSEPMTLLVADMPIGKGETVYARLGDWFAWLELVFVFGVLVGVWTKRR